MIVRQSASTAPLVARASQRRPAPPLIFRGSPSHALERAAASKPKEKAPRRKAATARPLHKSAGPAAANCRPGYHESSCVRSHGKESWFLLSQGTARRTPGKTPKARIRVSLQQADRSRCGDRDRWARALAGSREDGVRRPPLPRPRFGTRRRTRGVVDGGVRP